jgi:hypothetical protein
VVTITVDPVVYRLLEALTSGESAPRSVEAVIGALIDHAQQGVYRPGSWERGWLCQVFGGDWTAHLDPGDPWGRVGGEAFFERPRQRGDR